MANWFGFGRPQANAYAGAGMNRLTADWIRAPIQSADQEIKGDLQVLRGRSRELERNNAYAARFLDSAIENIVGARGIRLQARVTKANDEFDRTINKKIEDAWDQWGYPENCSADGRMSWIDIQGMAVRSCLRDGELLIRRLPGFPNNPFGFALQVLDPDQLDHTYNERPAGDRNEVRMGVEQDVWGKPVAYWLWTSHPNDFGTARKRERIPAEQIIHRYLVKRPGQSRGVPIFAPILLDTKMLGGYQEAELVAARTAAAKMGFWVPREDQPGIGPGDPIAMEASPGTFEFGPANHDFQTFDPQHPSAAFKDFNKAILRSIATGLGVSYNSLANDLEGVNYSSIRAGLLSERDVWKRLQVWLACYLHREVYREWMKWALTTGALELPSRNVTRWEKHQWLPRGWPWVDPSNDITASLLAIRGGLDSRSRIVGEQGRDFEETLADLDREKQLAEEYDVELSTDTKAIAATPAETDEPPPDKPGAWEYLGAPESNGNGAHAPLNRILG